MLMSWTLTPSLGLFEGEDNIHSAKLIAVNVYTMQIFVAPELSFGCRPQIGRYERLSLTWGSEEEIQLLTSTR